LIKKRKTAFQQCWKAGTAQQGLSPMFLFEPAFGSLAR
jgi:hypothetical protein